MGAASINQCDLLSCSNAKIGTARHPQKPVGEDLVRRWKGATAPIFQRLSAPRHYYSRGQTHQCEPMGRESERCGTGSHECGIAGNSAADRPPRPIGITASGWFPDSGVTRIGSAWHLPGWGPIQWLRPRFALHYRCGGSVGISPTSQILQPETRVGTERSAILTDVSIPCIRVLWPSRCSEMLRGSDRG
jgi:hypothetical protein